MTRVARYNRITAFNFNEEERAKFGNGTDYEAQKVAGEGPDTPSRTIEYECKWQ